MIGKKQKSRDALARFRKELATVHGFVTMTPSMAKSVRRSGKTTSTYYRFMNYPLWMAVPATRRKEVVYIDNSRVAYNFSELIGFMDDLGRAHDVPMMLASQYMTPQAKKIAKGTCVTVRKLDNYDYASQFGLLLNVNNFNQAAECMPRKLLTYAMCGMRPLIHSSFTESIQYMKQRRVPAQIYSNISQINLHEPYKTWDGRYFSIEARIGELRSMLVTA
jgi:hypothetical protein